MSCIGILSTIDNPQLAGYLASLSRIGLVDYVVICDSKCLSLKQIQLFSDRLGGWSIAEHFNFNINRDSPTTPFYFVENHNSLSSLALIKALGCSFLLNAGTPRKLSGSILSSTVGGVLNIHPGALPSYRGKNCPEWAIFHDERVILSAHIMEAEYDEGDVLKISEVDWRTSNSYVNFRRAVYLKSFELASKVCRELVEGTSEVLFNSKSSKDLSVIRNAMPDELLQVVKNRFNVSL